MSYFLPFDDLLEDVGSVSRHKVESSRNSRCPFVYSIFYGVKPFVMLIPPLSIKFMILWFYYLWMIHHVLAFFREVLVTDTL
jgi:hypothetical protein